MSREIHGAPLVRCLAVWLLASSAALCLILGLGPEIGSARRLVDPAERAGVPFDGLLTTAAAVMLTACALWLWAVTTLVVAQAMAGRVRSVRGCPDGVRRLVLAACGLAMVAAATPAAADSTAGRPPAPDDSHAVSGLPLPDRASAGPSHPEPGEVHMVRTGDTLWAIAAGSLPGTATDDQIDRRWREVWATNTRTIGDDPDLIRPGTVLHLPTDEES